MPFDFKGFKKVSKGATHTIFEHPDGHIIHVAHQGLDKEQSKDMNAIPVQKLWGGGVSGMAAGMLHDNLLSRNTPEGTPVDQSKLSMPWEASQPDSSPIPQPDSLTNPDIQPQQVNNTGDMFGAGTAYDIANKGADQYKLGLQGAAQAEGDLGKNVAGIKEGQATQAAQDDAALQEENTNYLQESQNMRQEIASGHIDPKQYINNMSTGSRVMTGIGLLLGGLGSGGDPSKNPALTILQKDIDRDIDSQKANLDTKKGLLNALSQEHGNYMAAMTHHRAISNEMIGAQIEAAANQMQDPIKKYQAMQLAGKFQFDSSQQLAQLQMMKNVQAQMKSGQGNPALMLHLLPKDEQTAAAKELAQVQNNQLSETNLMSNWDAAAKENTLAQRAGHLGYEPASLKNLRALTLPLIHDQEGRVNEFEQKTLEDLEPAAGDSVHKQAEKRKGYLEFIRSKSATPILDKWGIRPKASASHPAGKRK